MKTTRIIEVEPSEVFKRDSVLSRSPVLSWDLGDAEERSIWKVDLSGSEYEWKDNGLDIDAERRFFSLTANVDIDTLTVDTCEIETNGLYKKPIAVSWAAAGESFSKEARVSMDTPVWTEGQDERYRLMLKGHPLWTGKISRLQIAFVLKRTNVGTIQGVTLSKEKLNADALVTAGGLAWRFDVDNEVRSGWLGVSGQSRDEIITVPEHARLNFAMGALGRCSGNPVFTVVLIDRHQQEYPLFSELYSDENSRWLDRQVDLSPWTDQEVVLRFRTEDGSEHAADLPVWGSPVLVSKAESRLPNIVLIDLDTLRADHMSAYGYQRPTTPMIDEWAMRSGAVLFENTIAAAPWTLPAHVSMFTAIDAHKHGVNLNKAMPRSMRTLAEVLRDAGYSTLAVTGGGFVHSSFGFGQGFDEYRSFSSRMGFRNEIDITTREALIKLERHQDRPFFLFYHTYEIHNPFRPRDPALKNVSGRETEFEVDVEKLPLLAEDGLLTHRRLTLGTKNGERVADRPDDLMEMAVDLYDAGIAHTDSFVGRVLARIEDLGLAENTIVVITSDHGELFGEHDEVNHYCVYDGNVYVPLIISAPGGSKKIHRIEQQVRSIDMMPTLLDLAGLTLPEGIDGVTLRQAVEGGELSEGPVPALSYAAASNFGLAIRHDEMTYILRNGAWHSEKPREEFFQKGEAVSDSTQLKAFDELRSVIGPAIEQSLPGLRVVVSNLEGSEVIEGFLRGPLVGIGNVKISDIESGILKQMPDGSAKFLVEPGQRFSWIFEGLAPMNFFVQLGQQHFRLEFEGRDSIRSIVHSGRKWEGPLQTDSVSGDGVFLWRVGTHYRNDDAPELSADVMKQLEILGYVE